MKILKSLIVAVGMIWISSCSPDWGRMDDPAGNQTFASKEQVGSYSFEYSDEKPLFSDMDRTSGEVCEVINDATLGSNVLHLNGGYVRTANPLKNVKLQNGAAVTMWVNLTDEELDKALFSFGYGDDESGKFYFTPNAGLVYTKPGQLESLNLDENNSADIKTGAVGIGEWHFVALQVANDGYQVYVDGQLRANKTNYTPERETDFDYKTLVKFLNNAPYLYIGAGVDEPTGDAMYDDITVFRNKIEKNDWNKSLTEGGNEDTEDQDPVATITEIGTADCSADWWTTFSDYYTVKPNESLRLSFTNHTSGENNWNNWNIAVTTNAERNTDGYTEYFVMRSDLYGWGDANYNVANITNTGYDDDWDRFRKDMEGAKVDITIERKDAEVYMTAVATCESGAVYTEMYHQTCGDANEKINVFLIADHSYLQMDTENTAYYTAPATTSVGTADCTAAWWTSFSDYFTVPSGKTHTFEFVNHTSGANNWNNWNMAVTTKAERNADGYTEYFVMRSDLYGWGDANYNAANMTNTGYDGDWDRFRKDMEGAKVKVTIKRDGAEVYMTAVATCESGAVYTEMYHQTCGEANDDINVFFTVDGSYLVFDNVGRPCFAQ